MNKSSADDPANQRPGPLVGHAHFPLRLALFGEGSHPMSRCEPSAEAKAVIKELFDDWGGLTGAPDEIVFQTSIIEQETALALDRFRAAGVREWLPISEYPRDHDPAPDTYWGPNVLLFVPTGSIAPASDYRILTGRLEADMWLGWGDDGAMYDIEGAPTHWMPLPEAP